MPKGVEHIRKHVLELVLQLVPFTLMPKGVEHRYSLMLEVLRLFRPFRARVSMGMRTQGGAPLCPGLNCRGLTGQIQSGGAVFWLLCARISESTPAPISNHQKYVGCTLYSAEPFKQP